MKIAQKLNSILISLLYFTMLPLCTLNLLKIMNFKNQDSVKDNKANQPQVVVGLVVTRDGLPLSCKLMEREYFPEGHTFIPILKAFKNTHKIEKLTVVADSAMLSKIRTNIKKKKG